MDNQSLQTAYYLAANMQALRKAKKFSQEKLSTLAEVPRSTITNMESGESNPSLSNLCKVALALNVSIEELLSKPRERSLLIEAKDIPLQKKAGGKARIRKMMPDKIKGIEIDQINMKERSSFGGHPHLPGTKEYLFTLQGELSVFLEGKAHAVKSGDLLAFPGEQKHSYKNTGKGEALAISIVLPVPQL